MRSAVAGVFVCLTVGMAKAETVPQGWFSVPAGALFQTGDAWIERGVTYRLYGVQACLRGTSFTNALGLKRDCGEASLAMLVSLVRDLQPRCYVAAAHPQTSTAFVFCIATRNAGAGSGMRIDLGTALISIGYAFAALNVEGRPVNPPYLAAERVAQKAKAGLWAFPDLPNPNAIILRALRSSAATALSPEPPNLPSQRP